MDAKVKQARLSSILSHVRVLWYRIGLVCSKGVQQGVASEQTYAMRSVCRHPLERLAWCPKGSQPSLPPNVLTATLNLKLSGYRHQDIARDFDVVVTIPAQRASDCRLVVLLEFAHTHLLRGI
eukprot:TRINITY_DN47025_c0_g1_i1.p1 TRINITY_DN47025_c0_g1~~TRINITY_DN47025_c0_g1_i1.p1  ORF type:complete len:123 (+),score=0.02 TRINITY_DN47025_c0_g1_i1:174-542(+)